MSILLSISHTLVGSLLNKPTIHAASNQKSRNYGDRPMSFWKQVVNAKAGSYAECDGNQSKFICRFHQTLLTFWTGSVAYELA